MARWSTSRVRELQRRVKAELAAFPARAAALGHALRRAAELDADPSADGRMQRAIYAISALVQHARHGGLSQRQVTELAELVHAILRVQKISPGTSALSFLYGELHLTLSQIQRRKGRVWDAAWEQQLAVQLTRKGAVENGGNRALATGIRFLRLGHAGEARASFQLAADDEGLSRPQRRRALLYLAKLERLCSREPAWEQALARVQSLGDLTAAEQAETAWEGACRDAWDRGDLKPLRHAVRPGRLHHQAAYLCEAYLWSFAHKSRPEPRSLPALSTLVRRGVIRPTQEGIVYRVVQQLAECYDASVPFALRLCKLGELLGKLGALLSVDLELLVWLGATRWLLRHNARGPALLTFKEYQALSRRLTDGASGDCLRLAADLTGRWEQETGQEFLDAG